MEFLVYVFGLDDNFIKWIMLFSTNIHACLLQSAFLSEPITIQCGCRQGDSIAHYLFLNVSEILNLLIENNPNITGIKVSKVAITLAQFMDDTAILLQFPARNTNFLVH